jgi:hypothetical protein
MSNLSKLHGNNTFTQTVLRKRKNETKQQTQNTKAPDTPDELNDIRVDSSDFQEKNTEISSQKDVKKSSAEKSEADKKPETNMPFIPEWKNKTEPEDEKELTFLFYINGQYDDIGEESANVMIGLERAGSNEDVNIVTQLGRNPKKIDKSKEDLGYVDIPIDNDWTGIRRYKVEQDNHEHLNRPDILQDYLKIEDEIPENPLLKYVIGKRYWSRGEKEKAEEYFEKARELGIVDFMENPDKDSNREIRKEFNLHTKFMQEGIADSKVFKSEVLEELPKDAKMSDPAVLEDFIEWGIKEFPAENYVVVVMAHGGAWVGVSEISPKDMGEAIESGTEKANAETGRDDKIDALIFNSCYMGNVESLTEFKNAADISVASENYSTTGAFKDWPVFIKGLQNSIANGESFDARKFTYDMVEYYRDKGKEVKDNYQDFASYNKSYLTLTAVDNSKLDNLADSWQEFLQVCKEERVTDKQLFTAVENAMNYPSTAYNPSEVFGFFNEIRSMGSIMDEIKNVEDIPEPVKEAADNVKETLNDVMINEQHEGIGMERSSGLTIWAPADLLNYDSMAARYPQEVPDFAENSGWMERLNEAASNVPGEVKEGFWQTMKNRRSLVNMTNMQTLQEPTKERLRKLGSLDEKQQAKLLEFTEKDNAQLDSILMYSKYDKVEKQMLSTLANMENNEKKTLKQVLMMTDEQKSYVKETLELTDEQADNLHTLVDLTDEQNSRIQEQINNEINKALEFKKLGAFTADRQESIFKNLFSKPQYIPYQGDIADDLIEEALKSGDMTKEQGYSMYKK